ncbi:SusC/RagA family TonB-linked outer membrane protein [Prolixibacter bellariivorans]|uniref:SusC/RagA family TonB-linked outer membrane protein n=1 Tax=Prolixibacter bellariivorans TaxID=314319 RepID=UPI000688CBFD|nr:SusC/RagA family TonB-linked outer membrane protein [Prolixibacter bellariivorans]
MKKIFLALVVWLALISSAYPQHTVTGTVVSESDGQPIPGVSIVEKGVNNGTVTDTNGNYSIAVQSGNAVLVYSFVWMENKEVPVDGRSKINISMITKGVDVDDVVTTALGIPREKKSLGYAVAGVGSNYFSIIKETNPVNSLAGRIAGVSITPGSFGPGSNSCVIIRGRSSLTGSNEPLYVVDGIPMDQSSVFSLVDYGSGMADINPDDIASISVLKGPNAAALYGSRAANGVIMITTKQGSARKGIGVTFSSNTTFENPMLLPDYQNEYGQGTHGVIPSTVDLLKQSGGSWGPKMDGSSQLYYTGENHPYSPQPDNVKDFFDTGSTFINTLALTGGREKVKMRFSFTNTSKNLTIPNSRVDKNYFNLRSSARLTNKLTIDARATYLEQYDKNFQGSGPEGLMSSLFNIPRNVDINDYKNYQEPTTFSSVGATTQNSNPYWTTFHDRYDARKDRFLGFVKVRYDIASWLSAYARIGTDATNMNIETVNQYGNWNYPTGKFNYLESQIQETNADFLFLAKKGLTPRISLSAAIGGNAMQQSFRGHEISGEDFLVPEAAPFLSASVLHPGFYPLEKKKINSLYGTASLSFNYWLYLDVSARNDWSSTLPENGWSYLYPAISTSILLNNLLELKNSIMNYSKVRLSWAKTGNATPPFQLYNTYGASGISGSYLGEITMSRDSIKMNPSLKPEQVSSLEVGCELHFFDNRLYTDVSYYDMKSKNLSLDVPVSPSTGYKLMRENTGEIRNRGVEVTLGAVPVRNRKLTWDIAMNFAMNKNKVSHSLRVSIVMFFQRPIMVMLS